MPQQCRFGRVALLPARHFERAENWGAAEDAERLHQAEKNAR
jgi:hypothetical protein